MGNEWLKNLKVGDEVAIPRSFGGGYHIHKVTHLTATRVLVMGYHLYL